MTNQPLPPPGWYPDPNSTNSWRWWSGTTWTNHTAVRSSGFTSNQPTIPVASLYQQERQIESLAIVAAFVISLAAIGTGLFEWFDGHAVANVLHAMRIAFDRAEQGKSANFTTNANFSDWNFLFTLLTLAAQLQLVVWQYRAAKVARQLGYVSRFTPTFGAVSWIIPIINFWVPYRAIRDLLPEHHHTSRVVGAWWITVLIGIAASGGLFFAAAFSRGLGAVLLALVIVDNITRFVFQRAIITEVSKCHATAPVGA